MNTKWFEKVLLVGMIVLLFLLAGCSAYCPSNEVKTASAKMMGITEKYIDAFALASSTSRIALAGSIESMQEIKREANAVEVPQCLEEAKYWQIQAMEADINAFMLFMAQASDRDVNSAFDLANQYWDTTTKLINEIGACMPNCVPTEF